MNGELLIDEDHRMSLRGEKGVQIVSGHVVNGSREAAHQRVEGREAEVGCLTWVVSGRGNTGKSLEGTKIEKE